MCFKLILVFVEDSKIDIVLDVVCNVGVIGVMVINNVRGEGLNKKWIFFGLLLDV